MLGEGTADHIARLAVEAMRDRGECRIALVVGSTPRLVYEQLAAVERAHRVWWSAVQVCFGDERCVPLDDEQSNYRMARQSLLCHVPIPEQNMHRIHREIDPEEAAQRSSLATSLLRSAATTRSAGTTTSCWPTSSPRPKP